MTTREPGARDVLTQGLEGSPRATAFGANRPAATMTSGLDVLVQLVMAATTTCPSSMTASIRLLVAAARSACRRAGADRSSLPSDRRNVAGASVRVTKSCGRDGPANEGTTVARSRSLDPE